MPDKPKFEGLLASVSKKKLPWSATVKTHLHPRLISPRTCRKKRVITFPHRSAIKQHSNIQLASETNDDSAISLASSPRLLYSIVTIYHRPSIDERNALGMGDWMCLTGNICLEAERIEHLCFDLGVNTENDIFKLKFHKYGKSMDSAQPFQSLRIFRWPCPSFPMTITRMMTSSPSRVRATRKRGFYLKLLDKGFE